MHSCTSAPLKEDPPCNPARQHTCRRNPSRNPACQHTCRRNPPRNPTRQHTCRRKHRSSSWCSLSHLPSAADSSSTLSADLWLCGSGSGTPKTLQA